MPAYAVLYRDGKGAIQDTLDFKDDLPIHCKQGDAEYRVHYSAGALSGPNGLENLRSKAKGAVDGSHGGLSPHPDSLPLTS
jgi:hypothetical protein